MEESERRRPRVLHFVTGGFSGATQVAVDLATAQQQAGRIEPLLVLRRKRHTKDERVQALRDRGLNVWVVSGWSHLATIIELRRLCLQLRPDVLVAHGFPEHLIGRHAGLWAGVPRLVQVEHNSRERYTAWRLAQARWLAKRSSAMPFGIAIVSDSGMPSSTSRSRTPSDTPTSFAERFASQRACARRQAV